LSLNTLIGESFTAKAVGVCENKRTGNRYMFECGTHRKQRFYRVWFIPAHAAEMFTAGEYMDRFTSVEWYGKETNA